MTTKNYWNLYYEGHRLDYTDPETAVFKMSEAREMAMEAGDSGAVLTMSHWILQNLIHRLHDYNRAYDLAVQTALEARKPEHQHRQEHICVQEDLINTYIGIDPIGYSELIENALTYMEGEITTRIQCRYCLLGARSSFEDACGNLERMKQAATRYMSESENYSHHYSSSFASMCYYYYQLGDWETMLSYAERGEELNTGHDYADTAAELIAAQALALRKLGREREAVNAYRRATNKAASTVVRKDDPYYDMLVDYHLAAGELDAASKLRERHLENLCGKGQIYWEAYYRLDYARLLKQLDCPYDEQIEAVKAILPKLRKPEKIRQMLDELVAN